MYKANVFWPFTFGMRPFYSVKPAVKLRNMQLNVKSHPLIWKIVLLILSFMNIKG